MKGQKKGKVHTRALSPASSRMSCLTRASPVRRGLEDELLFPPDLDGRSRVLVVDDAVFRLDLDGFVVTDCDHDAFLRFFLCGLRDKNPARGLCLHFNHLYEDAISERCHLHVQSSSLV